TNDLAKAAAQKYCDVVSYNFYKKQVGDFKPVEGEDKPVMIGEFHFGALDRGMFHTGLGPCADQNARAEAYEAYVRSALENPWIVGAHWFQYGDQPTTGRFDGENYQIGLLDVCDRPYSETIDAVRRVGYNMYQIRRDAAGSKAK
ncbi:MAG: beta-agarase, partial [Thermoguttaceae bacterium]|nr:beta-agarase [Thermoguttaceae bacterium]